MLRSIVWIGKPLCVLLSLTAGTAMLAAAEGGRVELELIIDPGLPVTAPQEWMRALKEVRHSGLRIRQGRPGEELEIIRSGDDKSPSYRVIAALTSRNQLLMPGGKTFTMADARTLQAWLDQVAAGGLSSPSAPATSAFGLTPTQLVEIHEALAKPTAFRTLGGSSQEIVARLMRAVPVRVEVVPSAQAALRTAEPVLDELEGVSVGTALAAALRPLGLVFAPEKGVGNEIRVKVAGVRDLSQTWPVGWPVEKRPAEVAPELYKFLNVDITDVPLTEALEAIQTRVQLPFLYDHNAIVRHRLEPAKVRVSIAPVKSYYKGALDKLLHQGQLRCELRVDEAESPFLWVSTLKK